MVVKKINKSNDWGIGFILQCLYQGYNFLQIDFIECVCESVCVSDQDSHTDTHTHTNCVGRVQDGQEHQPVFFGGL